MTENWLLQTSYKTPANTLINVRAQDGEELNTKLQELLDNLPKISEVEGLLGAVSIVQTAFQPSAQAPQSAPAQAQAAPQGSPQQYQGFFLDPRGWLASTPGEIQICSHGPYEYKSGLSGPNSKNPGQPYEMYVCRAPKNGGPGLDGVFAPQHPTQSKPRQWGSR